MRKVQKYNVKPYVSSTYVTWHMCFVYFLKCVSDFNPSLIDKTEISLYIFVAFKPLIDL